MSDSDDRLDLGCPKQGRCPGCALGDRPYGVGLELKRERAREAFAGYAATGAAPAELRAVRGASPALDYRLRAKLVSERRALGLYAQGTHRVVDLDDCRVLSPSVARAGQALRRRLPLPIHGADLRETSEGVLLTLLTEQPKARSELEAVARALVEEGVVLSVAINVRAPGEPRLLSGEPELLVGPAAARHRLSVEAPYAYAVHGGFVQAHARQASYLQQEIAGGLATRLGGLRGRRVLELFAGNGSLALVLARAGAELTAVEAYAPAIALAERAAREQSLELRGVAGDAAAFLDGEARSGASYAAVIVNPPRRGLAPRLRAALGRSAPRAVAYVSCNPRTLARDSWHLSWLGLRIASVEPLDMIPWSEAVEALAWLEPAAAPAPQVLFESERWVAVDKPPHEPIAAPGEERCLLARVRALPGCAEALPLESWGDEVSGICVFAKRQAYEPALRLALSQAERELGLLARGNLRKQGTITRRAQGQAQPGSRYKKEASWGRHSLLSVLSRDASEVGALRDFASISHPVLGDARHGDPRSNQHVEHRYGLDRFVHHSALRWRPEAGVEVELRSELAPDLAAVLDELGSDETAV